MMQNNEKGFAYQGRLLDGGLGHASAYRRGPFGTLLVSASALDPGVPDEVQMNWGLRTAHFARFTIDGVKSDGVLSIDSNSSPSSARSNRTPVTRESRDSRATKLFNQRAEGLDFPTTGTERLPYELLRKAYFRSLVRIETADPYGTESVPQFLARLTQISAEDNDRRPVTAQQREIRNETERAFREYVASCEPMTPESEVSGILVSSYRTVVHPNGEQTEVMLAELRNRDGNSILCFDGKLRSYQDQEPAFMMIASTAASGASFQFEVLYSRAAYQSDVRFLQQHLDESLVDGAEYPYLLRRLRTEVARLVNKKIRTDALRDGEDPDVAIQLGGRSPDEIDILHIQRHGKCEYNYDYFRVVTSIGQFNVHFMWSEHDYAVGAFAVALSTT
jgi:hypothetical protein